MTDREFRDWLRDEVGGNRMTPQQRDDLLEQKQFFDRDRARIEQLYRHRVAGYVDGVLEVGQTVQELLANASQRHPGRMVYFEPIGFSLF